MRDSFPDDPVGHEDGVIWDADLAKMADQLDDYRVRNGCGDEQDEQPEAREQGAGTDEVVGKVEGETRERREEVLELIRGRLIKAFRDVYYKSVLHSHSFGASYSTSRNEPRTEIHYDSCLMTLQRHLLTESRSRRVIITTNPFLSDPIKQLIGRVLLDNLQVSSCSPD